MPRGRALWSRCKLHPHTGPFAGSSGHGTARRAGSCLDAASPREGESHRPPRTSSTRAHACSSQPPLSSQAPVPPSDPGTHPAATPARIRCAGAAARRVPRRCPAASGCCTRPRPRTREAKPSAGFAPGRGTGLCPTALAALHLPRAPPRPRGNLPGAIAGAEPSRALPGASAAAPTSAERRGRGHRPAPAAAGPRPRPPSSQSAAGPAPSASGRAPRALRARPAQRGARTHVQRPRARCGEARGLPPAPEPPPPGRWVPGQHWPTSCRKVRVCEPNGKRTSRPTSPERIWTVTSEPAHSRRRESVPPVRPQDQPRPRLGRSSRGGGLDGPDPSPRPQSV